MSVMIGSARIDENGHICGGKAGDQTGKEVSTQAFYVHSKGWHVLHAKDANIANKIASAMKQACANNNIGYDQNNRLDVLKHGTGATVKTECDCSSLVRLCVKEASGKDPGNFNTANEVSVLQATGLFEATKTYRSGMTLYTGDILVTKTKGHTVVVVSGTARSSTSKPKASGSATPSYTVGKVYTVQVDDLNVRTGAGTSYRKKSRSELTADGRKHADAEGQLKKGTRVTCKAVKNVGNQVWIQTPSGWICAYNGSKYYVK